MAKTTKEDNAADPSMPVGIPANDPQPAQQTENISDTPFKPDPDNVNQHNTVTITKAEYDFFVKDQDKLSRLEAAGVDNWDGYHDAMRGYDA